MCLSECPPFKLPLTRVPENSDQLLNLKNKVVLVSGGSRGIGKATCARFFQAGCHVIGTSRTPEIYCATVPYKMLQLDVRDDQSVESCIASVVREFGQIDILVNCAGIGQYGRLLKAKIDDWTNLFQTNLFGVHRVTVAAYEHMKQPDSRVITIGSLDGEIGWPYQALYAISKRALQMWNDSFDFETRNEIGPRFSLLEPAFVDTGFGVSKDIVYTEPDSDNLFVRLNQKLFPPMLKELGIQPEQVAQAVYTIAALPKPRLRCFVGSEGPLIMGYSLEDLLNMVYQEPPERILEFMDALSKVAAEVYK